MKTTVAGSFTVINTVNTTQLVCTGEWSIDYIPQISLQLKKLTFDSSIEWDLHQIQRIDTSGVALIETLTRSLREKGMNVKYSGMTSTHAKLLTLLYPDHIAQNHSLIRPSWIQRFGRHGYQLVLEQWRFFTYLGEAIVFFFYSLLHPSRIRFRSIIANLYAVGVSALPIILLSAFLIGIVITYQSIVVLQKYGADLYIVDMAGISLTRELAPLITAIVVAGRSGSAFTAQIGVMKITQEIDAMKTMGFNPFYFLVWPRVIALMIAMPLLIFFADIIGILGSMLIAYTQSNLSYGEFINRLQSTLALKHFIIGISKGPFFAFLIAITATFRGFQVSLNTESIGLYTTKSVVNSIFLVIACDALFSILLTEFKL